MNKPQYTPQFKQEAVQYAHQHPELTSMQVSQHLGIGLSTLYKWQHLYRKQLGQSASQTLTSEQQRLRSLERENAHLREVNEILKKAHVYFVNNPSR
jgi:transposase